MNLPLAVMLGLAGSSTAFLQSVRPTNFVVPAHKYNAAVTRPRATQPRYLTAGRNMRIMSAAVDETETTAEATDSAVAAAEEIPAAVAEDPMSAAMEVRERTKQRGWGKGSRGEG